MGRRAPVKALPSQAELLALFDYEPQSGRLTWKSRPGVRGFKCAGIAAGTVTASGYLIVGIHKKYYGAHRIIWKMMTGDDPDDQVDHKDGNRLNNVWSNFRAADNRRNRWNSRIGKNNRSGVKGVCWDAGHKAWRAYITISGTQQKLGRFKDLNQAAAVVAEARTRMHGEFARAN